MTGDTPQVHIPDSPEHDDLKFRRGLYHVAFNYLAWKMGADHVLQPVYNDVRRYVRYAHRGEAWPYAQVQYPDDQFNEQLELLDEAPGKVVRFISYLGMVQKRVQ